MPSSNDGVRMARLLTHRPEEAYMLDTSEYNPKEITTQFSLYDILEFTFTVNQRDINEGSIAYAYFACDESATITQNTTIRIPQFANKTIWNRPSTHKTIAKATLIDYNSSSTDQSCDLVANMFPKGSDLEQAVWIYEVTIYALQIPLWFILKDFQPMKSRSIIPLITVLFNYGISMTSFSHYYADLTWNTKYECLLYGLIIQPAFLILSSLHFLNYLRYILILNINKSKEAFSKGDHSTSIKMIRFLKNLTSETFMILWILFLFLTCEIYCIIIFFSMSQKCTTNAYIILSAPMFISVFPFIGILCIFFYDIIVNVKEIFCNFTIFLFYGDPFFYRVEQVIGIAAFLVMFPIIGFIGTMQVLNAKRIETYVALYYAQASLTTVFFYLINFYLYGFVCIVTIITNLYSACRKKKPTKKEDIERVFDSKELKSYFVEFAKQEWSIENVDIYSDILEYQKSPNVDDANKIYSKYLAGKDSPCEVNVSQALCLEIRKNIDDENITNTLFDNVRSAILLNLTDTYSRFIFTSKFEQWDKLNKFKEVELSNL